MKAILVLDEMPAECDKCPFYDGAWGVYCMATNEPVKAEEKPSWCPLKEIPEDTEELDDQVKRLVNEYLSSIWGSMKETMK